MDEELYIRSYLSIDDVLYSMLYLMLYLMLYDQMFKAMHMVDREQGYTVDVFFITCGMLKVT